MERRSRRATSLRSLRSSALVLDAMRIARNRLTSAHVAERCENDEERDPDRLYLRWLLYRGFLPALLSRSDHRPARRDILRQLSAGQIEIGGLHYRGKERERWLESVMDSAAPVVIGTPIRVLTTRATRPAIVRLARRKPSTRDPTASPAGIARMPSSSDLPRDKKKILTDRDPPVTLWGKERERCNAAHF
jgi:hypothetical protein